MSFLKTFLASFLAIIAFCLIGFAILVLTISILNSGNEVVVPKEAILKLELDGQINELQRNNPLAGLPAPIGEEDNIGLLQLIESIHHAKTDDHIKGIELNISEPHAGFSALEEIRSALVDFRNSGKWVYAYSEDYSEGAYYLSSVADKVFLNPAGRIEFDGLTVEISFYKKLLDKLEIKPEVFRVGQFKSAVEPFLFDKMSPENRLQLSQLANGIYDQVLHDIAESRNVSVTDLRNVSDNMLAQSPELAVHYGLIDSITYQDGFTAFLKGVMKTDADKKLNYINYNSYRKSFTQSSASKNVVAVIVAEGTIVGGGDDKWNIISSDKFVHEIDRAADDDRIKAIVFRVNSPGGEFQASDIIWNSISRARKKKPVIASMSDYGASGGYYISMACDTIVAEPTTITGSIGIFGILFDLSNFMGDKLGVTFDRVSTGNYMSSFTMTRPLNEGEKKYLQDMLDRNYQTFTEKAAAGRSVDVANILKYAGGRVWTGQDAKERNLIDVLGGFDKAVEIAAGAAGIKDYRLRYYPESKPLIEQLLNAGEDYQTNSLKKSMGDTYVWYEQCKQVIQNCGAQARMPFEMSIH